MRPYHLPLARATLQGLALGYIHASRMNLVYTHCKVTNQASNVLDVECMAISGIAAALMKSCESSRDSLKHIHGHGGAGTGVFESK